MLFSDESNFFVQGKHSRFVRIRKGEQLSPAHFNEVRKDPQKKMICGSFSFSGVGSLMPTEGMMNLYKYIDVMERKIIPDMTARAFPDGGGKFQNDLAPCLSSEKVKTIFRNHILNVLDCPANSPDLNPVEKLWRITKSRLQKFDYTTVTKLTEAIIHVWYRDNKLKKTAKNCWNPCQSE